MEVQCTGICKIKLALIASVIIAALLFTSCTKKENLSKIPDANDISQTIYDNIDMFYEMIELSPYGPNVEFDFNTDLGVQLILLDVTGDNYAELLAVVPFADTFNQRANYKVFAFDTIKRELSFIFYGRVFAANLKSSDENSDMGVLRCITSDNKFVLLSNEIIFNVPKTNIITTEIQPNGKNTTYSIKRLFCVCEDFSDKEQPILKGLEINLDKINITQDDLMMYRTGGQYEDFKKLSMAASESFVFEQLPTDLPQEYQSYLSQLTILNSKGIYIGHFYKVTPRTKNIQGALIGNGNYLLAMENDFTAVLDKFMQG